MSKFRNFIFTHNNYADTKLEDELDCRFIAYSKEVAPTTGTPHLQGYVCFVNQHTVRSVRSKMPGCHVEVMRGSLSENDAYISKLVNPVERGDKPLTNDNKGRAEQLRWHRARQFAESGEFDKIDSDIFIKYMGNLKRIRDSFVSKPDPQEPECYWIYGPTGTGKSHMVETKYPDCYKKNMDDFKWFDNYKGEEVVYLEDFDKYQVKWAGTLKRLADKWPMQAQIKGSMQYIRPRKVIVTSNYLIDEIWDDDVTRTCLKRRFKFINKETKEQDFDI